MGGAILTDASFVTIYSTKIINNIAISGASLNGGNAGSPGGGGVYLASFSGAGYTAQIVNTIIADNQIELGNPGTSVGGGGGGLMVQAVVADIIHSTFANNKFVGNLNFGQAIAANGSQGPGGVPATANIKYSIIADHVNSVTNNTSALTVAQGSTANINRVLFAGNTNDTNLNNRPVAVGTITGMNTVISANPVRFVSPGAPGYEYHLLPNSPAIDQAVGSTTTIDIDGDTRPIGSYPDLGADEAQQSVTGATFYLYLPLTKK